MQIFLLKLIKTGEQAYRKGFLCILCIDVSMLPLCQVYPCRPIKSPKKTVSIGKHTCLYCVNPLQMLNSLYQPFVLECYLQTGHWSVVLIVIHFLHHCTCLCILLFSAPCHVLVFFYVCLFAVQEFDESVPWQSSCLLEAEAFANCTCFGNKVRKQKCYANSA